MITYIRARSSTIVVDHCYEDATNILGLITYLSKASLKRALLNTSLTQHCDGPYCIRFFIKYEPQ